jgi:hypothetical protein
MSHLVHLLEARLFGDALGGEVGGEGEGDDLVEIELAGPLDRCCGGLGGEATVVEVGLDAPGELDLGGALDRGPGEAAAAGEGAGLLLDRDPGAEAVVLPVGAVAVDQLVEDLRGERRQGRGAQLLGAGLNRTAKPKSADL